MAAAVCSSGTIVSLDELRNDFIEATAMKLFLEKCGAPDADAWFAQPLSDDAMIANNEKYEADIQEVNNYILRLAQVNQEQQARNATTAADQQEIARLQQV
jgi:hypothetical protein